jgi:hypothetical protein
MIIAKGSYTMEKRLFISILLTLLCFFGCQNKDDNGQKQQVLIHSQDMAFTQRNCAYKLAEDASRDKKMLFSKNIKEGLSNNSVLAPLMPNIPLITEKEHGYCPIICGQTVLGAVKDGIFYLPEQFAFDGEKYCYTNGENNYIDIRDAKSAIMEQGDVITFYERDQVKGKTKCKRINYHYYQNATTYGVELTALFHPLDVALINVGLSATWELFPRKPVFIGKEVYIDLDGSGTNDIVHFVRANDDVFSPEWWLMVNFNNKDIKVDKVLCDEVVNILDLNGDGKMEIVTYAVGHDETAYIGVYSVSCDTISKVLYTEVYLLNAF